MGIRVRVSEDGKIRYIKRGESIPRGKDVRVFYDARLWWEGKEYVECGFTTRGAAEAALGNLHRKVANVRLGLAETPRSWDPTYRELAGDPDDPNGPADGTYLAQLSLPNNRAPTYVRRVCTALRALLPFFGDKRISQISKDLVGEYQRERLSSPLKVGLKQRLAAEERRKAEGKPPKGTRRCRPKDQAKLEPPRKTRLVGPACVNRELLTLRASLAWAADSDRRQDRRIERNPLQKLSMLQEPEARNPTLTVDDEQRLLAACRPPWLRELVVLLLSCGLRPAEGLALRFSDLNPDQGVLTVRHSKNNRSRLVPVPARVLTMLLSRKPAKGDGLIFTSRTGLAISSGKAAHHFTPIARELGLVFTLHGCRHIFASRMLSAGASLPQIAAVLGQRSLAATTRYSHARLPDLQTLVDEVANRALPKLALVADEGEI